MLEEKNKALSQRQKLYNQGLREASEYRLPDGIRDIFVENPFESLNSLCISTSEAHHSLQIDP